MQKQETSRALDQDLKEAVSLAQRHNYERMLKHAHDLMGLGAIERQVMLDSRLTQRDRSLLLSAVARCK
ncbi:MAG: hypothetical protein ACLP9K_10135 [Nitrososphaerales archaeon]